MKTKQLHFNRSQLMAALIDANIEVHIIPRGEGKTEGIISRKIANNAVIMPRSLGALSAPTFEGMLSKTLPPVIKGLAKLGYYKDVHYLIGRKAPKAWKKKGSWQDPFFPILKPEYFIHFWNGSGLSMVSFNRDNSSNGISIDYLINDEAKFLVNKIKTRYEEELIPALRGNRHHFGKFSQYQGITLTTDQPTKPEGRWLYDYEEKMNVEQIEIILGIQYEIATLRSKLSKEKDPNRAEYLKRKIRKQNNDLNRARMNSIFYHEPAPLANFEILGEETYKRWKRVLPDFVFRSSVLNERVINVEDSFYPHLDDDVHAVDYTDSRLIDNAFNSNFKLSSLKREDSRHDTDIISGRALDVAVDWGDHINVLVVGQAYRDEYHVTNGLFVKKPEKIQDLAEKFCNYYQHHRTKRINLPYDQTAYGGHGAFDSTYIDEFIKVVRKNGWSVNAHNLGAVPSHESRYLLWSQILSEKDPDFPKYRFNKMNCEFILISMHAAPAKQSRRGFEKDKKSERDRRNTPQEEATHFSDAMDTLAWYKHSSILNGRTNDFGHSLLISN
jgi:hypothetical protein